MIRKCVVLITLLLLLWVNSSFAALDVFVSIPPQKWLVGQIGGDEISVQVLVDGGQDPHIFEPTPRQVASLSRADIWFTMGLEFEELLARKVKSVAPELVIVNLAKEIMGEEEGDEEHHHHHHHHHHDQGHDDTDPHVWLSPINLQVMGEETAHVLSEIDPDNKDIYGNSLGTLTADLGKVHESIQNILAPYAGRSFYVYHPSFGHFSQTYGLIQEPVEIEGKSPGPRGLAKLISKAKKEKIRVLFVQPQFDQKSAEVIAAAIGGSVIPMDPLAENVIENLIIMAKELDRGFVK